MSLEQRLENAQQTVIERSKIYGSNNDGFLQHARALMQYFPAGLTLKTENDFARFILLIMITTKLSRYLVNFSNGGHQDSIHDLGVYSFILEEFDDTRNRE